MPLSSSSPRPGWANLIGTDLRWANLSGAINLAVEQLSAARGDDKTKLLVGLGH